MPFHSFEEQHFLQIYCKLEKWEFENEFRTIIFEPKGLNDEARKRIIPQEAFKEIILGKSISTNDEKQIRQVIKKKLNHLTVTKK